MKSNINQFTGNLLATISECLDILGLLDEMESYDKVMPPLQKMRVQKYLVDLLVTKLYTLFDTHKDVISFERLLHEYLPDNDRFKDKFSSIKKTFDGLIKRVKNNRKKVAHNPKQNTLGFSEKEIKEFESQSGMRFNDFLQPYENQYIHYRNLPRDGIIVLLQELKSLVFYDVLYPNVRKPISQIMKQR